MQKHHVNKLSTSAVQKAELLCMIDRLEKVEKEQDTIILHPLLFQR